MKQLSIILFLVFITSALLLSQTFVEWTNDGWGQGLGDCRPAIIDIDSDGLLDLFIGNYEGYISHFEQTAPNSYSFSLLKHKLNNINVDLFASPAFADIDKDGLIDMIIGEWKGNLHHYEQVSPNADSFLLITEDFNSINVGGNASPYFTDLNQDGLLDLLIGAHSGNLFRYEQEDTASEIFTLLSDSLGIDPPTFRINPTVVDIDQNGLLDLIVGGNFGDLSHFEQIEAGSTNFSAQNLHVFGESDYMYGGSAPCIYDIDNDGLFDLLVGEMDGLYYHFEQSSAMSTDFTLQSQNFLNLMDVGSGAAPCLTDLDDDGLWDLIVGEWQGNLNHFKQTANGSTVFDLTTDTLGVFDAVDYTMPAITDLDADGLLDLIIGEREGTLMHLEQDPENPNEFSMIEETFNGIDLERFSAPCFTDLDGDGLIDMIIGENEGKLHLYEQLSPLSYGFHPITDSMNIPAQEFMPTPQVIDFDDNGLLDLFIGVGSGKIYRYEQIDTNSIDFVVVTDFFGNIDVGRNARISFGDINQDDLPDMVIGNQEGGLLLYLNRSNTQVGSPVSFISEPNRFALDTNYPNPFHSETQIRYEVPVPCDVLISVYDMQGKLIKNLVDGHWPAGRHIIHWDASDQQGKPISSGVYVLHMKANAFTKSIIISFIK